MVNGLGAEQVIFRVASTIEMIDRRELVQQLIKFCVNEISSCMIVVRAGDIDDDQFTVLVGEAIDVHYNVIEGLTVPPLPPHPRQIREMATKPSLLALALHRSDVEPPYALNSAGCIYSATG